MNIFLRSALYAFLMVSTYSILHCMLFIIHIKSEQTVIALDPYSSSGLKLYMYPGKSKASTHILSLFVKKRPQHLLETVGVLFLKLIGMKDISTNIVHILLVQNYGTLYLLKQLNFPIFLPLY